MSVKMLDWYCLGGRGLEERVCFMKNRLKSLRPALRARCYGDENLMGNVIMKVRITGNGPGFRSRPGEYVGLNPSQHWPLCPKVRLGGHGERWYGLI